MWVTVLQTKVQVGVIFDEKYFYRHLLEINNSIDFIVNSINFQYNYQPETGIIKQIHAELSSKSHIYKSEKY